MELKNEIRRPSFSHSSMELTSSEDGVMFQFESDGTSSSSIMGPKSGGVVEQDESEEKVDVMLSHLLKWMSELSGKSLSANLSSLSASSSSLAVSSSIDVDDVSSTSSTTVATPTHRSHHRAAAAAAVGGAVIVGVTVTSVAADAAQLPEEVFKILLGVFDRLLLTTNQTKYAQWSLFYVCRLREDFNSRLFEHLFDIVQNVKYPPQQRQRACMYIASLASRASFIKESTTQMVLNYMCNWMTQYVELQGDSGRPDLTTHVLFYAMFHAISYILKNVHDTLFDCPSAKLTIQELGINMIVRSPLNPLKVCSPALVQSFIEVMSKYGISFTNVIQHNEKLVLPARDMFGANSPLTDFFPFDPYLLKRSSAYLLPYYHFPEQQQHHKHRGDPFESGYATEGETEMDMDLRGHHDDHDVNGMDDEDTHTTESMMAMMDFGRGSMPSGAALSTNATSGRMQISNVGGVHNALSSSGDALNASTGLFGSFDEKSSLSSGHGSNSFTQGGGFLIGGLGANNNAAASSTSSSLHQPSFGHSFGVPFSSTATSATSTNSFISHSPLRGASPSAVSLNNLNTGSSEFAVGSLEARRTPSKRSRDENWAPSTPISAALFNHSATRPMNSFAIASSPSPTTSSSAWGSSPVSHAATATVFSAHTNNSEL